MFSLVKQGLVNLLIEDHKILGIFHLQQILESDVKQIPKPWDIYRALSLISCHQWEVYSGVLKGGQNPRGLGKLIELGGDGVTRKERGTDHGGNHTWRAGKSTISGWFSHSAASVFVMDFQLLSLTEGTMQCTCPT